MDNFELEDVRHTLARLGLTDDQAHAVAYAVYVPLARRIERLEASSPECFDAARPINRHGGDFRDHPRTEQQDER
jgi:hypothetical protein